MVESSPMIEFERSIDPLYAWRDNGQIIMGFFDPKRDNNDNDELIELNPVYAHLDHRLTFFSSIYLTTKTAAYLPRWMTLA